MYLCATLLLLWVWDIRDNTQFHYSLHVTVLSNIWLYSWGLISSMRPLPMQDRKGLSGSTSDKSFTAAFHDLYSFCNLRFESDRWLYRRHTLNHQARLLTTVSVRCRWNIYPEPLCYVVFHCKHLQSRQGQDPQPRARAQAQIPIGHELSRQPRTAKITPMQAFSRLAEVITTH